MIKVNELYKLYTLVEKNASLFSSNYYHETMALVNKQYRLECNELFYQNGMVLFIDEESNDFYYNLILENGFDCLQFNKNCELTNTGIIQNIGPHLGKICYSIPYLIKKQISVEE